MNPVEFILESPHRWWWLAGISALVAILGATMMLAYAWPHTLGRIWFWAWFVAALYFLVRGLMRLNESIVVDEPDEEGESKDRPTG